MIRRGLLAATLGVAAVGAAVSRPDVVLLSAIPLCLLAAGSLASPPTPELSITRSLSSQRPGLGDRVTVTLTVENEGPTLSDCCIEDTLPPNIESVDTSHISVRLPAGETATLEYTVVARRGTHEFGDVTVTARGLTDETTVSVSADGAFRCRPEGKPLSLRAQVSRQVGSEAGETGGSGIEFHSVREYRPSDPQRRIDWRRFARTRELTTVEFREERLETVHLLVDARPICAVRGAPAEPSALGYCADAAERLAAALGARGTDVGLGLYPDNPAAVPPGSGRSHRQRVRHLLDGHEAFPWGDGGTAVSKPPISDGGGDAGMVLPEDVGRGARVVMLSPCFDDSPAEFVETVRGRGGDIGLVAPDVGGETPGAIVERALRADRIERLAALGVPVVDWDVEVPLERAIEEVFTTWR